MVPDTMCRRFQLIAALALALPQLAGAAPRVDGAQAVRRAAATYAELERKDVEKLSKTLDALTADPAVIAPFRARDRDALLAAARPIFERLKKEQNITHWYFLEREPARTCFLRVHAPALFGDVVERETFTQAIASHKLGFGKELGKTAFALRVVKPVKVDGKLLGYMELGEEIDHFLARMKSQTGDDFALLVDKGHVDRKELARVRGEDRWSERPDVVLIESTMWNERNINLGTSLKKLPANGAILGEWKDGSRSYAGGAFPVRDAANTVVGALFVRHPLAP